MFTELNFILQQRPIIEVLEGKLGPDEFKDKLNHHIHGYGSWGYEDAEKMNLKVSEKYTTEQAQELLQQIKESKEATSIEIKEIDKVPSGIAYKLAQEVGGGSTTVGDARSGDLHYGALKGHELVGFVSGEPWNSFVSVGGLFVYENHRKEGLSSRMFEALYRRAKTEGLEGFCLGNASWAGQDALRGFHRFLKRKGIESEYSSGSEDLKNWAELEF